MSWAVSYGDNVIVAGDMAVSGQVVWILDVTSTAETDLLDHADCGLCGKNERETSGPSSIFGRHFSIPKTQRRSRQMTQKTIQKHFKNPHPFGSSRQVVLN